MKNWDTLEADEERILTRHFTYGRAGYKIDKIVLHHNAGNLSIQGCYDVWQTREASAHYQVQSDGRIGQLVWDTDTAWHVIGGNGTGKLRYRQLTDDYKRRLTENNWQNTRKDTQWKTKTMIIDPA